MAGINKHLKASTLMESLIAMIIIVTCLATGTLIYSNVLESDKQRVQLKAMFVLNSEAHQAKTDKYFLDSEKQLDDYTIKKTIERYEQAENLYQLTVSISDKDGKIIASRNELITTQ